MKNKLAVRARRQGFKARSVYKLFEINKKFNLINDEDSILDIGCYPGSWMQACLKLRAGRVVGIDKKEVSIKGTDFIKSDILDDKVFNLIKGKFDVVLSDVAPNTTGDIKIDQYKSYVLSLRSLEIAIKFLKSNGNFLVKIFQGEDTEQLFKKIKSKFGSVRYYKPASSYKRSKEIYIIAKYRNN